MSSELIVHLINKGLCRDDEVDFLKKALTKSLDSAKSNGQYAGSVKSEKDYTPEAKKAGIIILPFMDESCTRFSGLEEIRKIRLELNDFMVIPFFVCWTKCLLPNFLNPETIKVGPLKHLLGTPHFGEVEKAILYAEAIYNSENATGQRDFLNFIVLSSSENFVEDLAQRIFKVLKHYPPENSEKFRMEYYHTFVRFYSFSKKVNGGTEDVKLEKITIADLQKICEAEQEKYESKKSKSKHPALRTGQEEIEATGWEPYLFSEYLKNAIDVNDLVKKDCSQHLYPVLELADLAHCLLHGRKPPQKSGTHNIPLEIFSSPVPFHLQELLDSLAKVKSLVGDQKKLKLLLIDNKDDKLKKKPGVPETGALGKLLGYFHLQDILEIGFPKPPNETFQLGLFKSSPEYAQKLYQEIKEHGFILLDFFLNEDKTYLAFDFINDIEKKVSGAPSAIWYFITSAFYDAVSRYSQSGLLAEHYESAVVSSGDDPMNSMRKIVFVYKLITFISARWKNFEGAEKDVFKAKPLICDKGECPADSPRSWEQCLRSAQAIFKRYIAEYDQIKTIFPKLEYDRKMFRETVELLDNTLNHFLWLPEADWPIINWEIESIDLNLIEDQFVDKRFKERDRSKIRFSCPRIRKEIERRMEVY